MNECNDYAWQAGEVHSAMMYLTLPSTPAMSDDQVLASDGKSNVPAPPTIITSTMETFLRATLNHETIIPSKAHLRRCWSQADKNRWPDFHLFASPVRDTIDTFVVAIVPN